MTKKNKFIYKIFSFFISILFFLNTFIGVCAEEITPTPTITPEDVFYIATQEFIEQIWDPLVSYVSLPFAISKKSFTTAQEYFDWLQNLGEVPPWEQYPNIKIHSTHPPTGDIPLDVEQSDSVEVPLPVQNSILAFVQYQIAQNPQGFKQCYISSYNYLNTSQFNNFQLYSSVKEVIKQHDLSFIMAPNGWDNYNGRYAYICCVDRSKCDVNFYGSTLNGVFTSVYIEHNWAQFGFPYNQEIDGVEYYMFANNKTTLGHGTTIQSCWYNFMGYNGSNWTPSTNGTIKNTTGIGTSTNAMNVFTGSSHDELVYVFDSINAYKNYNSGVPKDYYLTSEGISDPNWDASGNGIINTGQLDQSSYSYNNVVSNIQSGWTAEEVLQLVDKISQSNNNSNGSSNNTDDDKLDLGFLGKIGNLIAKVINGIGDLIVNVLTGITNALIGEDGTGGILGLLKNVLSGLTNLITEDFATFINGIFSFMPSEIRTVLLAGFTLSVFIGVLKLIRK